MPQARSLPGPLKTATAPAYSANAAYHAAARRGPSQAPNRVPNHGTAGGRGASGLGGADVDTVPMVQG